VKALIDEVELKILVEDTKNPEKPWTWAEHGLSVLITAKMDENETHILLDTGQSGKTLLHNAYRMNVDFKEVDAVVLSHGHYDHAGGLLEVLKCIEKPLPIILHPEAIIPKFVIKPRIRLVGIPFTVSQIKERGGELLFSKGVAPLADDIFTTGQIERTTSFEKVSPRFLTIKDEVFAHDNIIDDQALIIDYGSKGLVVITGCAHAGIINTIKYAQKVAGKDKIYAVLGGFHLVDANEERIERTIQAFKEFNPNFVAACHCTGEKAIKRFTEEFSEKFIHIHTGTVLKLQNESIKFQQKLPYS
jgi:7,8-dihydropterin-6-yl-methyl-4-(beta-D-ribofuranosyl)aminobenzene 5'-phosphate synthase